MALPKELNPTLKKAFSDSYTKEEAETFNRVERRMAAVNRTRLKAKLDAFRSEGKSMDYLQLQAERHDSSLLGKFMRAAGMARPGAKWEAHHMISGAHKEAALARQVLADDDIKIRIDDPVNGCWMPKTKQDARPTAYPNAIGHNRIHREKYYRWVYDRIFSIYDPGLMGSALAAIRAQLMNGNIQEDLLLKEIDGVEYKDWLNKNK